MAIAVPHPEGDVVARLIAGDEPTFAALIDRHHRAMLGVASTFTTNRALAEEIVQETWMAVLTGLPRFEGRSSLKTWIFHILANRARTRAAREARTVPLSALGEDGANEPIVDAARFDGRGMWAIAPRPWELDTPEAIVDRAESLAIVEAAIDALPARQRAVVLLRDVETLDSEEVCRLLGVTEANQRVLLHRGRAAIRAALEAHLGRA